MKNDIPEILTGRLPMGTPFSVKEGQCLLKLKQKRGEGREEAVERAKNLPWYSRILNPTPRFFNGFWIWLGRKER
jgi:hypothetical protein